MKFLCSLLLVFSVSASASLPAAEIDTAAVLRCGNMVQHVNGIQQSAADVAMEALAPPQTKADKWFVTVVTIKGCGLCTKLKDDWQKNANLSALANPDDPERSWANFHYYDYQDASQTWRFENLDIKSFPTILVQPPRSGKYGDPTTVVFQSTYKGKPTDLANDITSAIKQYVVKLQQTPVRETQHGQAPWDGVRIPLPAFDQLPPQIPPADSTSTGVSFTTLILSVMGAGIVPFLAVAGLNAWRSQRKSNGKQLILDDAQFESLLKLLNQQPQKEELTMADLLQRGMVWLTNQLQDHASQPIVYVRGDLWVELQATLGRTVFALDQEIAGVPVEYGEVDFLIRSGDVVLAGQRVEPADHDEIWWTDEGVTRVYEALAPGNEPSWRYADPFRRMFRIHTKFIRTELFAMPGTLQNITLYRGSETRTIQVDPDLSLCTEIDFRQYAGGGFQVPASSSLNGYTLVIYAAVAPGASYSQLVVNGNPVTMTIYQDQFNELPEQVYGAGALKFSAPLAGSLELVLKT